VILVHGLTLWRDPWRQWLAECAAGIHAAGGVPICFRYARPAAWAGFLHPSGRSAAELVRRFVATYDGVCAQYGRPSVIAHSFGAYLVTRALSDFESLRLHAVIAFGSIVSETFDWATVVERGQLRPARIRNEVGAHTAAVRSAAALRHFGYPYGASGVTGFWPERLNARLNVRYSGPRPGDAGFTRYCLEVWAPFLGLPRPIPGHARRRRARSSPHLRPALR
jgi:hypothetical protein